MTDSTADPCECCGKPGQNFTEDWEWLCADCLDQFLEETNTRTPKETEGD